MGYLNDLFKRLELLFKHLESMPKDVEPTVKRFDTPWGSVYYHHTDISYSSPNGWGVPSGQYVSEKASIEAKIRALEANLQVVVSKEDYEKASKVRDQLKELKENYRQYEHKLADLEKMKKEAVEAQNYEDAANYKREIEALIQNNKEALIGNSEGDD